MWLIQFRKSGNTILINMDDFSSLFFRFFHYLFLALALSKVKFIEILSHYWNRRGLNVIKISTIFELNTKH